MMYGAESLSLPSLEGIVITLSSSEFVFTISSLSETVRLASSEAVILFVSKIALDSCNMLPLFNCRVQETSSFDGRPNGLVSVYFIHFVAKLYTSSVEDS